ncbi:MAG: DUF3737 family protein [Clostridium sp.]|nr:DUF3737 family protein [Clostridium sp.]
MKFTNGTYDEERALYGICKAEITDCSFDGPADGESALKETSDITVEDSVVCGEYLGWYSENLKLVRCKITGTQPLCYCRGLVLEHCTMEQTDLSFENSEVHAVVSGKIDSVKNPVCGEIHADEIGELILEEERIDKSRTKIICAGNKN